MSYTSYLKFVWLDLPVSPELAQAANPHDILVRGQLFESGKTQIFWDYAFYGGHWYSYFGVVPVVPMTSVMMRSPAKT